MKFPKIFNNKPVDDEEYFSDEFILATDYLEQSAVKLNSNIRTIATYFLDGDAIDRISSFYHKTGNKYNNIIHDRYSHLNTLHYNFFAEARESHSYEQEVQDDFKNKYNKIYLKKKELPDIEISPIQLAIISDNSNNGSLASFLSFFNIPQISALILGIDLENIYFSDSTYAYFSKEERYPKDYLGKFSSCISSIESEVLNDAFDGINVQYYNNRSLDLIKTNVCRRSLEKYLAQKGYILDSLVNKQSTLATDVERMNLLQKRVIEQDIELKEKQDQIMRLTAQLTQTCTVVDNDKELIHNSQIAITRLLNTLFYMGDYDIKAHSGTTNKKIVSYSNRPDINTPVTKGFVTTWIKNVHKLREKKQ